MVLMLGHCISSELGLADSLSSSRWDSSLPTYASWLVQKLPYAFLCYRASFALVNTLAEEEWLSLFFPECSRSLFNE